MGEAKNEPLEVDFDRRLRLEFHGARITSDAGLLAYREIDDALGLTGMASDMLYDRRTGRNILHSKVAMLRQCIFGRLAGYEDVNDADLLRHDPAVRYAVGGRACEKTAASASEVGWFETHVLSMKENTLALMDLCGKWVDKANRQRDLNRLVLDMDSSESRTYGNQQGSAFNGYFGCTCYHPLFLFNQHGDLERTMLRRGNKASAKFWRRVLLPVIDRYRKTNIPKHFRGDAAFMIPDLLSLLEEKEFRYAIRIPSNRRLEAEIGHLLVRPRGRPPRKPIVNYHSFRYQAGSWDRSRRIIAKVEWHQGELFPRVGFIVTNMQGASRRVVKFYNRRGTAEQWIKEGKNAIKWTKLSCRTFRDNEVRLQLFGLAYNLANFMRTLAMPEAMESWFLTTLREKLIKIGAKVVRHARRITFQMAEVAIPKKLFGEILGRIAMLRLLPG